MRIQQWIVVAALAAVPATAMAQDQTTGGTMTTPETTTTTTTTQTTTADTDYDIMNTESHWLASGFVGSNFGARADRSSVNFGGQIGYLWHNIVGAEFLADFTPRFKMDNALLAHNPNVNSYMVNAIGALPLGDDAQFQPYVSGGFGGIQLRSDELLIEGASADGSVSANQAKFGGNIGGGMLAFAGNVGVRGDVRYFRATEQDVTNPAGSADNFASNLLSNLDFWRANIGVAVRW